MNYIRYNFIFNRVRINSGSNILDMINLHFSNMFDKHFHYLLKDSMITWRSKMLSYHMEKSKD